ncbi:hypothetical protein BDZ94DRAFT_1287931, partial [Collybia nuda]
MRPLVSYDDITLPYQPQSPIQSYSQSSRPSPPKKRKASHQKTRPRPNNHDYRNIHHTKSSIDHIGNNLPSSTHTEIYNEDLNNEEHRELTHEEIWDDSALIEAWNAATEEYEAYNGPDKGWKSQPLHKSPLWYNRPPTSSQKVSPPEIPESFSGATAQASSGLDLPQSNGDNASDDSRPLNFDTFVPTHDPSLELPFPSYPPSIPRPNNLSPYLPDPPGPVVDQDEAFTRALGAMYWGGYWTAVYHYQRATAQKQVRDNTEVEEEEGEGEGEEGEGEGEEGEGEGEEGEDENENDAEEEEEFIST